MTSSAAWTGVSTASTRPPAVSGRPFQTATWRTSRELCQRRRKLSAGKKQVVISHPGDGGERCASASVGHLRWPYGHADQWVRLPVPHGVSYQCPIVTIALKCTVLGLMAWDRRTDGRTDRWEIAALLNAPISGQGNNN